MYYFNFLMRALIGKSSEYTQPNIYQQESSTPGFY
jgi:hypothetical protein